MSYNFKYKMIGTTTSGRGTREYYGDTAEEIYDELVKEGNISEDAVVINWIENNLDFDVVENFRITTSGIGNYDLYVEYEDMIFENITDEDYFKAMIEDNSHYYYKFFREYDEETNDYTVNITTYLKMI